MFIQIPEHILDKNISKASMILLGLIINLNRASLGCLAQNRYFAEKMNVSIKSINRYMVELKNEKYIEVDFVPRTNTSKGNIRIIVPTEEIIISLPKAKKNVIKAQNQWNKQKNLLPKDIESDWLDEYIASRQ